jgi:hypothetical protein
VHVVAERPEDYCWMWANKGSASTRVSVSLKR